MCSSVGLLSCGGTSEQPPSAAAPHSFVPHVVGANTAITGYGFFEAVELLRTLGYRSIEVQNLVGALEPTEGAFPGFRFDQTSQADKERILAALAPFDAVTVHLPYEDWMPYIDPSDSEGLAALEMCLDAAGYLGAQLAVLHPQPRVGDIYTTWDTAVERVRKWGAMAEERGFRLACETAMPNSLPDLERFLDAVNHDNVGVTLDVGHQARWKELSEIPEADYAKPESIRAYNDLNIAITRALGSKLLHTHTHDIEPQTWAEHKPLVHGFIDYPRFLQALREIEFGGLLMFEMGGEPAKMPEYLRDGKAKMDAWVNA